MRLTLSVIPGNKWILKHKIPVAVHPWNVERFAKRLKVEEQNMFYFRRPYLASEQKFDHEKALNKNVKWMNHNKLIHAVHVVHKSKTTEPSWSSDDGGNGHNSESSNIGSVGFLCTAAAVLFLWSTDWLRKTFVVEAAKPFSSPDYDTNRAKRDLRNDNEVLKSSKRNTFNFIADVVDAVGDSVVCIEVKDNTMIDWITGKPEVMSNGSGFIIQNDGLILTNAHVVVGRNRMSLTVKLQDGRTFDAHIEDVDVNSDLAIIRIKARGLPTMPLGSSSTTRIGEWVVALGSPLSLTNTVTAGVVSSVSRKANELGISVNDISYIQTDAAITFGNSGGPLVNLDGEAIGINSMKVAAGISFAIPIDYVKCYLADAEKRRISGYRKQKRRYMGATLLALTEDLVRELHASNTIVPQISRGVMVWKVVVGSPAYKCGLKPGDIIYKINGMDITTATPVFEALKSAEALKFHVIRRDGSNFTCVMYPEEVPEEN